MSDDRSSHIAPTGNQPADGAEPTAAADDHGASNPESAAEPSRSTLPSVAGTPRIDGQKTVISRRPPVSPPAFRRAANPFEMGEALEGEQLGHFQLEEFVGGGGMGAVFRATDTMLGRTVAVKVVSRDQTSDDMLRRFKNEAQSAARLDHPNIARVYYVGEDKGWNYIVLEYIEGVNVRDLVEHNGPLALEDAISYTLQIAEALEHASQRNVTHRDIKPSNILIMIDGRAKLVDMGLARLQQVESSTDDLTASGVTLGTFDYISPEQARDPRNTDVRSDLYSLGCTLFFMLTGQPPFPDGTVLQKLLSHSSDDPPDLSEYRPDVDEEVALIVNKLLAKQPDQRFQSPRELIGELLLLADRLDLSGIRANSTVWFTHSDHQPAWWVRHLPWSTAVAALLLFILAYHWVDSTAPTPIPTAPRLAGSADTDSAERRPAPTGAAETRPPVDVPLPPKADSSSGDEGKVTPPDAATEGSRKRAEAFVIDSSADAPAGDPSGTATTVPEEPRAEGPQTPPNSLPTGTGTGTSEQVERSDRSSAAAESGVAESPANQLAAAGNNGTQLIVVTDHVLAVNEEGIAVKSLDEALTRIASLDTRTEIELRFDGLRLLEPLVVDTDRFPENRLTIRAARGSSPVLAFRPPADASGSFIAPAMIHILGGHVIWQGVHFYMELAGSVQPREGQSLLRLETTDFTEFRDCTFTIRNVDAAGTAADRSVAFVDVVGPGEFGGLLFDSRPLSGDTPTIWLEDCIARGQAPFVRAEFAVPFSFSWEHGLFVSTERLVEVGGTIVEPRWEHGGVNIFLKRLLSVADKGICLVRADHVAPYPLGLSIECDDCLFATRATAPPTPLYVVRTESAIAQGDIPLEIDGNRNYYKNTQVVLRVETNGDRNAIEQYSFDDLTGPGAQRWFNEKGPEPAAVFSWESPSRSVDRQSLHDFIRPSIGAGWFTRALALAPSQLPRLPDISGMLQRLPAPKDSTPSPAPLSIPDRESPSRETPVDNDETTVDRLR